MTRLALFSTLACFMAVIVAVSAAPVKLAARDASWWSNQKATYYLQHNTAGACGKVNSDWAHLVALYTPVYANGANCGKKITIMRNGVKSTGVVADECPTCEGPGHIDLSEGFFDQVATQEEGEVDLKWWFDD